MSVQLNNEPIILTSKQEAFTQDVFAGMYQRDAYIKNYNAENQTMETLDANASRLATSVKVKARLAELRDSRANQNIASVDERRERLTQFIREDIRTKHGLIRQSNTTAIDLLNKMDRIYEPVMQVNQDNRVLNIYVKNKETKELLEKVGDRAVKQVGQGEEEESEEVDDNAEI